MERHPRPTPGAATAESTIPATDLTTIVENAFPEAGDTQDATVLKFKVNADPGIKTIMFDVVFGSDEFSEFSNSRLRRHRCDPGQRQERGLLRRRQRRSRSASSTTISATSRTMRQWPHCHRVRRYQQQADRDRQGQGRRQRDQDRDRRHWRCHLRLGHLRRESPRQHQDLEGILNEIAGTAGADKLKAVRASTISSFGGVAPTSSSPIPGSTSFMATSQEAGSGGTGKAADLTRSPPPRSSRTRSSSSR